MAITAQSHDNAFINDGDNHLEIFSLIWLDANVNAQMNQDMQEKLRATINHIKKFHDVEECKNYIEQTSEDDRLVLIVSGQLSRQIVPSIHQLRQVSTIYINSEDKESDEKWACEFTKLKGINVKLDELVSQINENHRNRWEMEESLSINMFTATSEAGKSTTGINGQFIFSQLLIDCLLRLKSNEMDTNELISCCEKEYEGNQVQLDRLRKFQKDYIPDKALWWYTSESFFYKTLNAALRKQNIHMLFLYRRYITDIHRQLQHSQSKCAVRVYRSQFMSIDELDYLQKSIGQFVSVNSFLSTTNQRGVADSYMADRTQQCNLERVLFEIVADPKVVTTKPFADISTHSHFADESEVLFMLGSIFRLNSIICNDHHVWIIGMSLCGDDEHSLKQVLGDMKKQTCHGKANLCTLGKVLWKMGKLNLAEQYYIRCVNEVSDNDPLLLTVYEDLADIASQQGSYEESVVWRQKLADVKRRQKRCGTRRWCSPLYILGYVILTIVGGLTIYLLYTYGKKLIDGVTTVPTSSPTSTTTSVTTTTNISIISTTNSWPDPTGKCWVPLPIDSFSTGSNPIAISGDDFDGDGSLDLVIVDHGSNDLTIQLGSSIGFFSPDTKKTFKTGEKPDSVAVGDFNHDSRIDIVVTNNASNNVGILLGNGDGTFADQKTFPAGSSPGSIVIGDFNNDGRLDVVVTNYVNSTLSMLLGFGNGTFAAPITSSVGSKPISIAIGDFNKDGRLDITVSNYGDNTIGVLFGHGNGSFSTQVTYSSGIEPRSIAVGDINNDTQLDIAYVNYASHSLAILFGYSNGTFASQAPIFLGNGSFPYSMDVKDLNQDTIPDIAIASQGSNDLRVFYSYGNGTLAIPITYPTKFGFNPIAIGINDGKEYKPPGIALAKYATNTVEIILIVC